MTKRFLHKLIQNNVTIKFYVHSTALYLISGHVRSDLWIRFLPTMFVGWWRLFVIVGVHPYLKYLEHRKSDKLFISTD